MRNRPGLALALVLPPLAGLIGCYLGSQALLPVRVLATIGRRSLPVRAAWSPAIVAVRGLLQFAGPLRGRVWEALPRWDLARLARVASTTGGRRLAERVAEEELEERDIENYWLSVMWSDGATFGTCSDD